MCLADRKIASSLCLQKLIYFNSFWSLAWIIVVVCLLLRKVRT